MSLERLRAALADRYRIERELGAGGMATVYLAQDLKHGRRVAIKVLKPEVSAELATDRFLREIRTTANLQHPHIVPVFDSGEAEGQLFFVMPLIEGESLRARLDREGALPVSEALRLIREVAGALQYAGALPNATDRCRPDRNSGPSGRSRHSMDQVTWRRACAAPSPPTRP